MSRQFLLNGTQKKVRKHWCERGKTDAAQKNPLRGTR
jgi:hypothetical protein